MDKLKHLETIYARVPALDCQKKCQEFCGPIAMTELEAERIKKRFKSLPVANKNMVCSKLKGGVCSIYELRPLICRLWGTVPAMRCPWGCKPKTFMSNEAGKALLREAEDLSPVLETR